MVVPSSHLLHDPFTLTKLCSVEVKVKWKGIEHNDP